MEKYSFNPYDSKFTKLYQREKGKLRKILLNGAKIEHIGSTAIPGLGGKGIIDIAISVPRKQIRRTKSALQRAGYDHKVNSGHTERLFFQKIYRSGTRERRVHIQLTHDNSHTLQAAVALRNYLRNKKRVAQDYAIIKMNAVKLAKGEGAKYRRYKRCFLDTLEKEALKHSSLSQPSHSS